jgi:hypothetical protein
MVSQAIQEVDQIGFLLVGETDGEAVARRATPRACPYLASGVVFL